MKLKRVVIKQELVELTGHHITALILNQFIYWSERTRDFDRYISEELERNPNTVVTLLRGWVYKTTDNLLGELMLDMSSTTLRRYMKRLVDVGYLNERHNPRVGWDRTLQYRPDMIKIQGDLHNLGYALDGYPLVIPTFKMKNGSLEMKNRTIENEGALPETTPETTPNISPPGEKSSSDPDLTDTPSSPSADRVSAFGDHLDDFQADVLESIGRHTDQEMLGSTEVPISSSNEVVSTNVRIKMVEGPWDYEAESCTCAALASSGGMPPCSYCENSIEEVDQVEAMFGTNPRQAQIDAYQPGEINDKPLVEAEAAYLRTFGIVSGSHLPGVYDTIQEIKVVWEIKDPTEELAIALFLLAIRTKRSSFAIPKNQGIRNDWIKSVRGHLMDYKVNSLGDLYQLAITKLDQAGMTFSRPGSLTKTLPDVVDEPTAKIIIDKDGGFYI